MQVLIIGAGLAGLTCARELDRRGVEVLVIEASDGVGGRVRSDNVSGFVLDRGFQVLFDAYPAVQRQLDLAALDLRPFDPGALICLDGQRAVLTDPLRDRDLPAVAQAALTPLVSPLDKLRVLALALKLRGQEIEQILAGDDRATVEFLRAQGFSEQAIDRFFRPFYGGIFLDRSLSTSAKCFKFDYKMLSAGRTTLPASGMGAIGRQLAAPLQARGRVRLGALAAELLSDGPRVIGARLASGEELRVDAVVVATPAPEAARLSGLPTVANVLAATTLYFSGDLPLYDERKIVLNAAPDALVNNAQLLTNVVPDYAPPGKQLLSVAVLGNPDLDDAALFKAALRDLHRMFAGDTRAQAALAQYQPLRLYRIPHAQFAQPPGIHPTLPDNRTERPGLYFAGEFTQASSLNAAMVSGEQCALALTAAS